MQPLTCSSPSYLHATLQDVAEDVLQAPGEAALKEEMQLKAEREQIKAQVHLTAAAGARSA